MSIANIFRQFLFIAFILFSLSCKKSYQIEFPKKIQIFGLNILASEKTSDKKIIHAAKILAQYLDNNEDGTPDNQEVMDTLISLDATLIMFENEDEASSSDYKIPEHDNVQGLWDDETIPSFDKNIKNMRFDATLEEVLHLTTHFGYSKIYTELSEKKGSDIASAMDLARGGYFENVPNVYPEDSWYSYDDITCDYECMITEYFYWTLTSILGAQSYPGRFEEISDEWKLNSKEKVKSRDIRIYNLLTSEKFKLPITLPDSTYNGFSISLDW